MHFRRVVDAADGRLGVTLSGIQRGGGHPRGNPTAHRKTVALTWLSRLLFRGRATHTMRYFPIQLLLTSTLTGLAAFGQPPQNGDISVMWGPVRSTSQVVVGSTLTVTGRGDASFQIDYAHTLHSWSFGDLWFENPVVFGLNGEAKVEGGASAVSNDFSILTPGVRLHVPVGSRVSFYGAAGAGFGSFRIQEVIVSSGVQISSRRTSHGVFDFGGGMDFRLTRLLSLRGEVRDYVTGRELGGVRGRNHPIYVFGLAFHF